MADYPDKPTDKYVRESSYRVEAPPEGSGALWFIVGGIVVAIAVLIAIFSGSGGDTVTPVPADGGGVTIENNAPAAPPATEPDAMAPAPAETAPAAPPADATPAPADTITPAPDAAPAAPAEGN